MSETIDKEGVPVRYLVPIPAFTVPGPWRVGRTTLHPIEAAPKLLAGSPPAKFRDGGDIGPEIDRVFEEAAGGTIAEVRDVSDSKEAVAAVRAALDALRLFSCSRRLTHTLPFGLPGDLAHGIVNYVSVSKVSAPGWMRVGDPPGGGFSQDDLDAWTNSDAFQFLGTAIANPSASEAARRASIGAQLFSRAALEQRADIKMLGIVASLEAWLLHRNGGPQTLRLARHVSWFGCGRHENDLCGRGRPVCPYLRLEPGRDNRQLNTLRNLGNTHAAWRCSEWHQVMDWYDARSDAAHGGDPTDIDPKYAGSAEFWVARYLAEPILDWLRSHPYNPIGDLETELDSIPEPAGWAAMVAALDADPPTPAPPSL